MVKITILRERTNNIFWPKSFIAMTNIKNLKLTLLFEEFISFIKIQN